MTYTHEFESIELAVCLNRMSVFSNLLLDAII